MMESDFQHSYTDLTQKQRILEQQIESWLKRSHDDDVVLVLKDDYSEKTEKLRNIYGELQWQLNSIKTSANFLKQVFAVLKKKYSPGELLQILKTDLKKHKRKILCYKESLLLFFEDQRQDEKLLWLQIELLDKNSQSWKSASDLSLCSRKNNVLERKIAKCFDTPDSKGFMATCEKSRVEWTAYKHELFLKLKKLTKNEHKFMHLMHMCLPGISLEVVLQHAEWHEKDLQKKQKQKEEISRWRFLKEQEELKASEESKQKLKLQEQSVKEKQKRNEQNRKRILLSAKRQLMMWKQQREQEMLKAKQNEELQKKQKLEEREKKNKEKLKMAAKKYHICSKHLQVLNQEEAKNLQIELESLEIGETNQKSKILLARNKQQILASCNNSNKKKWNDATLVKLKQLPLKECNSQQPRNQARNRIFQSTKCWQEHVKASLAEKENF